MTENTEIDDRVDLDDENYSEEDEDPELIEDEGAGEVGDENGEEQSYESGVDSGKRLRQMQIWVTFRSLLQMKKSLLLLSLKRKKSAELHSSPSHGSEVFIGGIPRDVSEEDLRDLCEPLGEIHEVRVMRKIGTLVKTRALPLHWHSAQMRHKAIEELHNKEFKRKSSLLVLFIGNVPRSWSDDDFRKVIDGTGPGAETIELIKDPQNPARNRGFVDITIMPVPITPGKKMASANFKLEGNSPTVTWADQYT
ncbi:hypothetical protein HAX54_037696 [Datura stramonium]|uniref:RRM domain-containing protein n=1 Tax=Datura stramonium TaxID=4076 RepID=A0ABS8SHE6_DATST|nr:hypothetical protein [Datura stramonium]